MERYGIKIGIFGLGVQLDGLVNMVQQGGTKYSEPVAVAQKVSEELKFKHKCDLIIAITHIGYSMGNNQDDKAVAAQTDYVDLILGGHTHTFLTEPEMIINRAGRRVWVNQTGAHGVNVGHLQIELTVGSDNKVQLVACHGSNHTMQA